MTPEITSYPLMRRIILSFLLVSGFQLASAQTWEVGGFAGTSGYVGDLNQERLEKFTDLAFGGQIKRNFDGYWSAKLNFVQARIQGDDAKSKNLYQQDRNLSFYSGISELSLQVEFNLFNYMPGVDFGYQTRRVSPFIFAGVAGIKFDPKAEYNDSEVLLQPLQTEAVDYKTSAVSIPYGVGVKFNVKGNLNLIGEIGYRTAFTDYLDDVSTRYPDFAVTPPEHPMSPLLFDRSVNGMGAGVQRGDFRPRDTYMVAGISLTYTFVPIKCPTF